MEPHRLNDRANGTPAFATTVRHLHFSAVDAYRRMQGEMLAALGFGPIESPYRVTASHACWRLRDYGPAQGSRSVLIVAAPIKRPYIWDLAPDVSVIRNCMAAGLRVHLLEWRPGSRETCHVGIAECVEAISDALAAIGYGADGSKPIVMGHSLGGTLAAIHAASAPSTLAGLVLLGSPLCFSPDESPFRDALVTLVPSPVADSDPYPGSILSQTSALASPHAFIWSRLMDAASSAADRHALTINARVERWALDEVALPGRLVAEIIDLLYRDNRFCRGILAIGERMVGPDTMSTPTVAVVNTQDPVAPLDSVSPLGAALGAEKFRVIAYGGESGVGLQHLGMLIGRQAHAQVWPEIIEWIKARQ